MTFSNITDIIIPEGSVSMIQDQGGNIIWQKSASGEIPEWYPRSASVDWSREFMQFLALGDGTVELGYMDYSFDGSNWTNVRSPQTIQVSKYQVLYIKTNLSYYSIGNFTFDFYVRGNLGLSITGTNVFFSLFEGNTHVIGAKYFIIDCYQEWGAYIFQCLFKGCSNLQTAAQLPATNLGSGCYQYMYQDCTSLVTGPVLPAMALTDFCYGYMFKGCTALVSFPNLPAMTVASHCCDQMFEGCVSLTKAPDLPATSLATRECYYYMFKNCSNLQYIKMLVINQSDQENANIRFTEWCTNVSETGIFVKHINTNWDRTGADGVPSGWDVIYYDPASSKYYLSDRITECDENGNPI